jgi:predicted MPP superfamily phosphohydrolase
MKVRPRRLLAALVSVLTSRRFLRGVELVAIALIGAWLGLLVGGTVKADVGPVVTQMSLRPALTGDTVVNVSPLGSLSLDSHDGPLRLQVDVTRLNLQDARAIFNDPDNLGSLEQEVPRDVWAGVVRLGIRSVIAALVGAALFSFLVFRAWRPTALASGLSLAILVAGVGLTGMSWNSRSVLEPRYSGLLASAPAVVGNAQNIVSSFDRYSKELAKLVTNVSKLYDVTSSLPSFEADPSTIRVLHVSDIHLNPSSWEVMRSIAQQFEVNLVVDSGDLTDHGSRAEDRFVTGISRLNVPYVFARGNHDSIGTEQAVSRQPAVTVLRGQIATVGGLRITGDGDPRFTPDRSVEVPGEDAVRAMGQRLADGVRQSSTPVDIAVVHDPTAAEPLDGAVPLVLAGHTHRRATRQLEEGTRLFIQGSTGGAGLRALETPEPTPVECSVLYFDRATRKLQAWDDITLGGLGLTSAEITRHLPTDKELGVQDEGDSPPSPSLSPSPSPTSTGSPGASPPAGTGPSGAAEAASPEAEPPGTAGPGPPRPAPVPSLPVRPDAGIGFGTVIGAGTGTRR